MAVEIQTKQRLKTLDRAILITVGMSKGGIGKSWVATNIAATLSKRGHYVALIDTNTSPNSHIDWAVMCSKGQNPGFHCYFDDQPFKSELVSELSQQFDVIVIDTPQYRWEGDVERAWVDADLLVAPVPEEKPDFPFFAGELSDFYKLRNGRTIAAMPVRCTMLKGQTIEKGFQAFLDELEDMGILVPRFEKKNYHLDYNQRVKSLPVRNIYYSPGKSDDCKPIEAWLRKWEVHVDWLVAILREDGIAIPSPRGEIDALPMFRETVTPDILKKYHIKTS